jgi:hypothetical protein
MLTIEKELSFVQQLLAPNWYTGALENFDFQVADSSTDYTQVVFLMPDYDVSRSSWPTPSQRHYQAEGAFLI